MSPYKLRSCYAGRVDDVINVSGHRVGTAEVEGALVSDASVDEAAVCGYPPNPPPAPPWLQLLLICMHV